MILPHSILGSLEEFRNYLECKGDTEVNSEQHYFGYIHAIETLAALVTSVSFYHLCLVGKTNTKVAENSWSPKKASLWRCGERALFRPQQQPEQCSAALAYTYETAQTAAGLLIWWLELQSHSQPIKKVWICMFILSLSMSLFIFYSFQLYQDLLNRPVENLLMSQANHFRETQEQREFLSQVMPLVHSGYVWHTFVFSGLLSEELTCPQYL